MKAQALFLVLSIGFSHKAFTQANDHCMDAISLEVGDHCISGEYTNIGATAESLSVASDPSCGSYTGRDVWFKAVMPASGALRVELSQFQGAAAPSFTIYSGSCGNFTEVMCARNDRNKTLYHPGLVGETLYLRVYSYFNLPALDFSLCVFEPEIPKNDLCENAQLLAVGGSCVLETFSSVYATSESNTIADAPSCGLYQGGDVWFKAVMPASGVLRINKNRVTGAAHPPMTIYSGSCGNFTEELCSKNDATETLYKPSLAGQTIYLRFYGYNHEEGSDFSLCLYEEEAPVNDDCEKAINIAVGNSCETSLFNNIQATAQSSTVVLDPSCGAYKGADVWFKLTVPASGNLRIETAALFGPTPPSITLYSGNCSDFEEVGCMGNDREQSFSYPALAGKPLFLRVFTFNSDNGENFSLCIFEPSFPSYDDCEKALTIPVVQSCLLESYSNAYVTQQPVEIAPNPSCGEYKGGDVWFKAEVPDSGRLRIKTDRFEGATYKSITVYAGTCGSFTEIACGQQTPLLTIDRPDLAGETVFLRLFSYASDEGGAFGLCIEEFSCATDTVDAGKIDICKGETYQFGTKILTEPGEYEEVFQTSKGCDSLVTLSLAVASVNTEVVQEEQKFTAKAIGASYQWINCSTENEPVTGETGQTFTISVDGDYAVIITENSCIDTSACFK
jgi:hypothetical protein